MTYSFEGRGYETGVFCIQILFLVANVVLRKITKAKEAGFPQHESFTRTNQAKEQTGRVGDTFPSHCLSCSSLAGAREKKRLPQAQWEEMEFRRG